MLLSYPVFPSPSLSVSPCLSPRVPPSPSRSLSLSLSLSHFLFLLHSVSPPLPPSLNIRRPLCSTSLPLYPATPFPPHQALLKPATFPFSFQVGRPTSSILLLAFQQLPQFNHAKHHQQASPRIVGSQTKSSNSEITNRCCVQSWEGESHQLHSKNVW